MTKLEEADTTGSASTVSLVLIFVQQRPPFAANFDPGCFSKSLVRAGRALRSTASRLDEKAGSTVVKINGYQPLNPRIRLP